MRTEATFDLDLFEPDAKSVIEREDGDLLLRGIASDTGIDRHDESFKPGAFAKSIQTFLAGAAPLLYHHDPGKLLGRVTKLEQKGDDLEFEAIMPKPPESSPLLDIYNKVKRGMMKSVSVRGKFERELGPDGRPLIHSADMWELSVTPLAVNPRTLFTASQKAFADESPPISDDAVEKVMAYFQLQLDGMQAGIDALDAKAAPSADQRKKYGMADGSFPIWHCGNGAGGVGAAKSDLGRTNKDRATVQAHISRRAKALGCPEKAKVQGS